MRNGRVTRIDILFLAISFFAIVVVWIGSNVFHEWVTTTISEDLQMQIIPIAPKFDTATIEKLKTREKVVPLFDLNLNPTPIASESVSVTTEPVPESLSIDESELEQLLEEELTEQTNPTTEP